MNKKLQKALESIDLLENKLTQLIAKGELGEKVIEIAKKAGVLKPEAVHLAGVE
jgi:hypothetical protein